MRSHKLACVIFSRFEMIRRLAALFGAMGAVALPAAAPAAAFQPFKPLPEQPPVPGDNPQLPERVELGRILWFDPRLSVDASVSCNSCHDLLAGGTTPRSTATGALGRRGHRNPPTVWNAAFQTAYGWDARYRSLEHVAQAHFLDPTVMGWADASGLEARLRAVPGYREAFRRAFGGPEPVTAANAARALAAFQRTLVTPDSPFDRYLKGEEEALDEAARRGLERFVESGCAACHFGVLLAGPVPGLALRPGQGFYELFPNFPGSRYDALYRLQDDPGRYARTREPSHKGMWRLPTLRNVALTAPYFHNGSVWSLAEAVRVMGRAELGRELTEEEVRDLVAFLKSLTGRLPQVEAPRLPPLPPEGAPPGLPGG